MSRLPQPTTALSEADRLHRMTVIGESLHGIRWRAPLARQMGITPRAMQRWLTGGVPVPATRLRQAEELLQARIAEERGRWTRTLESLDRGAASTV